LLRHVFVRSVSWCLPFTLAYLVVTWIEPIMNTFADENFFETRAPWLPGFVYKVTAVSVNCPTDTTLNKDASDQTSAAAAGNATTTAAAAAAEDSATNGTIVISAVGQSVTIEGDNHICEYCTYPIIITTISFVFCAVYLLMFAVTYARVFAKVANAKLLARLRALSWLFKVLIPLLVCVQGIVVIPQLNMVAIQWIWICGYVLGALVFASGIAVLVLLQMTDASRAAKHRLKSSQREALTVEMQSMDAASSYYTDGSPSSNL